MRSAADRQAMSGTRQPAVPVVEGDAVVTGATLRYRLVGADDARHTVVFENGWSGTFPYACWFEALLPRDTRVLFYDRAGVGDSRRNAPLSPECATRHLRELLAALGIVPPVVVMGHSYGGLIGVLHAAQAPDLVRALVQIDPTSELRNDAIDAQLKTTLGLARVMQLLAVCRLDRMLLAEFARELPPEAFRRMLPGVWHRLRSLQGSIAEFRLQNEVRAVARQSPAAQAVPRLVISADRQVQVRSGLMKLIADDEKVALIGREFRALHQRQAAFSPRSRWMPLPYSHASLVTNRQAAAEVWALTGDFLRGLPPAA